MNFAQFVTNRFTAADLDEIAQGLLGADPCVASAICGTPGRLGVLVPQHPFLLSVGQETVVAGGLRSVGPPRPTELLWSSSRADVSAANLEGRVGVHLFDLCRPETGCSTTVIGKTWTKGGAKVYALLHDGLDESSPS